MKLIEILEYLENTPRVPIGIADTRYMAVPEQMVDKIIETINKVLIISSVDPLLFTNLFDVDDQHHLKGE